MSYMKGKIMKAIVTVINSQRGMYAANIENQGDYVIFELLDCDEPNIDDIVSHPDFYSMGEETFTNITQKYEIDVYIQNICGANLVRQQCLF